MGIKYTLQNKDKVATTAWDNSDKNNYHDSTSRNIGQIGDVGLETDLLMQWITKLSSDANSGLALSIIIFYKTFKLFI